MSPAPPALQLPQVAAPAYTPLATPSTHTAPRAFRIQRRQVDGREALVLLDATSEAVHYRLDKPTSSLGGAWNLPLVACSAASSGGSGSVCHLLRNEFSDSFVVVFPSMPPIQCKSSGRLSPKHLFSLPHLDAPATPRWYTWLPSRTSAGGSKLSLHDADMLKKDRRNRPLAVWQGPNWSGMEDGTLAVAEDLPLALEAIIATGAGIEELMHEQRTKHKNTNRTRTFMAFGTL